MNFVHPLIEKMICINEGEVATLVIENPIALRNTVKLFKQETSEITILDGFETFDVDKGTEFIENIFDLDFSSKRIANRLCDEAKRIAENFQNETLSMLGAINDYADMISTSFDLPIKFSFLNEADRLMKLLNFQIETEDISLLEMLVVYMEVCRKMVGKKLFVILNFKSFISDEEFELFCKSVNYEKFYVLLLEAYDDKRNSTCEKKIIIDNDLCVICGEDEKYN